MHALFIIETQIECVAVPMYVCMYVCMCMYVRTYVCAVHILNFWVTYKVSYITFSNLFRDTSTVE
jgi:hypothetical protein